MRLARLGWLGVLVLALCACSTVSPTLTLAPTRAYVTATPIPPYVAVPAPTLQARVPTLGPTPAWSLPHCDGNGPIGEFERFPALSVRTWVSHQIVVGRVVEQLARAEVDANGQPQTFTYSLIVVEQRVRGQPEVALVLVYQGAHSILGVIREYMANAFDWVSGGCSSCGEGLKLLTCRSMARLVVKKGLCSSHRMSQGAIVYGMDHRSVR